MRKKLRIALCVLVCLGTLVLSAGAEKKKKEKKLNEKYTATAMGIAKSRGGGPALGRALTINITIAEYSTDGEVEQLAQALRNEGSDAMRKLLGKMKKGRVSPSMARFGQLLGQTVNFVRTWPTEKGRRILIATERPITFFELRQGTRWRDYEFGIIQLEVDEKGKGGGTLIAAAKIKFTEENVVQLEHHYGIQPVRLVNVRRVK